jgi:hypothetical protein
MKQFYLRTNDCKYFVADARRDIGDRIPNGAEPRHKGIALFVPEIFTIHAAKKRSPAGHQTTPGFFHGGTRPVI